MTYPIVLSFERPLYSYSADGTKFFPDKLRGLLRHGPYREAKTTRPSIAFAFVDSDRDYANRLYLSLRNGIRTFPGSERLVRISITRENIHRIPVPAVSPERQARAFHDAICGYLDAHGRPDFGFILHTKYPQAGTEDPYDWAKAAFTKYGVPTQVVTRELLQSDQQFAFATTNIALAMLVKLGGIPWTLSIRRDAPTLVIGIGRADTRDASDPSGRWLLGYATCVLSSGLYVKTTFFTPACTERDFLVSLEDGLRDVLSGFCRQSELARLTVHVSHFLGHDVYQTIQRTVRSLARAEPVMPIEVVHVNTDSDFTVLDMADPGYVSPEGTCVVLAPEHFLVVTEGRVEKAVWRGRKPVTLELRRNYKSVSSLSMKETAEDAFWLSGINWRGTNAVSRPISIQYAQLIAQSIVKMAKAVPNIATYIRRQSEMVSAPWFI